MCTAGFSWPLTDWLKSLAVLKLLSMTFMVPGLIHQTQSSSRMAASGFHVCSTNHREIRPLSLEATSTSECWQTLSTLTWPLPLAPASRGLCATSWSTLQLRGITRKPEQQKLTVIDIAGPWPEPASGQLLSTRSRLALMERPVTDQVRPWCHEDMIRFAWWRTGRSWSWQGESEVSNLFRKSCHIIELLYCTHLTQGAPALLVNKALKLRRNF